MAPKLFRSLSVFASVVLPLFTLPVLQARADGSSLPDTAVPSLGNFVSQMIDGQARELRGVYVSNVLADLIVQQPGNDGTFVSTTPGVMTQFGPANSIGSIGLLAHNYLAGAVFGQLQQGQLVYLVYGDGHVVTYSISQFLRYQALDPENPYSNFVDLTNGAMMSATTLFNAAYGRPGDVVLQTCIDANGNPAWVRLFIVAEPYQSSSFMIEPDEAPSFLRTPGAR